MGVEEACKGGERAVVRHHPLCPLVTRPHTVVSPPFGCAEQVEAKPLAKVATVATVALVVQVVLMVQFGLPKAALAKAMTPDSLEGDRNRHQ